ncbi:MAG: class I SAM-dependent methyltransferase [Coriobacteriia bacterium]|nr:class I SAM-dependent methyltransferase [Coriobacteriia bacterium]
MDTEDARDIARLAGLSLESRNDGLVLVCDGMELKGDFSRMAPRLRQGALQREMLVKAARVKDAGENPLAVDATAGLGEDSLLLAAAGFRVMLFERNPVTAALLADAIERGLKDARLAGAVSRMRLAGGDSIAALPHLEEQPDVVLLDPMFPAKHGDARAKKKLQLLQHLEQPCEDEDALLDAAFAAQPRKIVVKRPLKGPWLANRKPSYSLNGKTVRYDVHVIAR